VTVALIDADIVAYRCAASANEEPLDIALERTDALIDRIGNETRASSLECYLTGDNNFRKVVNPQYKANRKDMVKPRWLEQVREHLVVGWGAGVSDGNEADDELGISQCTGNGDTIICTIDKDLLQVPGRHYNFVTGVARTVSPVEGLQNLYFQAIMGDSSDNILGYDFKARQKVPKFLEPKISAFLELTTEQGLYDFVADMYSDTCSWDDNWRARLHMNMHCLYIWRKVNDKWQPPNESENQPLSQD
jgi:5'-3' exonuclease